MQRRKLTERIFSKMALIDTYIEVIYQNYEFIIKQISLDMCFAHISHFSNKSIKFYINLLYKFTVMWRIILYKWCKVVHELKTFSQAPTLPKFSVL